MWGSFENCEALKRVEEILVVKDDEDEESN